MFHARRSNTNSHVTSTQFLTNISKVQKPFDKKVNCGLIPSLTVRKHNIYQLAEKTIEFQDKQLDGIRRSISKSERSSTAQRWVGMAHRSTPLPIEDENFALNKESFTTPSVCHTYLPVDKGTPLKCVCGKKFSVDGGFIH